MPKLKHCDCCGRENPKILIKVLWQFWDGDTIEEYWCTKCVLENKEEDE